MNENLYIAILNTIVVLGTKGDKTKEESLTYDALLGHASAISRFNRLVVEDAIESHLDVTSEPAARCP